VEAFHRLPRAAPLLRQAQIYIGGAVGVPSRKEPFGALRQLAAPGRGWDDVCGPRGIRTSLLPEPRMHGEGIAPSHPLRHPIGTRSEGETVPTTSSERASEVEEVHCLLQSLVVAISRASTDPWRSRRTFCMHHVFA
jgi:hypothetical protein